MHFVGKILVVVQLILTICFMAFAGAVSATQANWKKAQLATQAKLATLQGDFNNLRGELEKARNEAKQKETDLQSKADTIQAQNVLLTGKVDSLTLENESLRTASTTKLEVASISATDAMDRRAEAVILRELYKKAQEAKDVEFRAKNKLEDDKFELAIELDKLKADYVAMLRENKKFKECLVQAQPADRDCRLRTFDHLRPTLSESSWTPRRRNRGSEYSKFRLAATTGCSKGTRCSFITWEPTAADRNT